MVASDPRLAIASAGQDVAEAQRRQALAELLPQASAQASLTRTRQERSGLIDSDPVYYDGERYSKPAEPVVCAGSGFQSTV